MGKARRPFIQAAIVSILSPERLPSISWCSLRKDGVGIYVLSPPLPSMHLVSPYRYARQCVPCFPTRADMVREIPWKYVRTRN